MPTEKLILPYVGLEKCQKATDYALAFARSGVPVIPLFTAMSGVCSCGKTDCPSTAKHPRTRKWKEDKSLDPVVIKRWFARESNLGLATGNGLVVIDIDDGRDGQESMFELEEQHGALPPTLTVNTGGGGVHYYFLCDEPVTNSVNELGSGIDVRGDGGYVVGPASTHRSGRKYAVDEGQPYEIAKAPAWLVKKIKTKTRRHVAGPMPDAIIAGGRNTHLTSMAGSMRRKGFSEDAMLRALLVENKEKCDPPLDEAEVKGIAQSVSKYAPASDADWKSLLKLTRDGLVSGVAGNAALLLSNTKEWEGVLQYDEFKDVIGFTQAPARGLMGMKPGQKLSDPAITHVQHWLNKRTGANFSDNATVQGITVAAHKNKLHPVRNYLAGLVWDKKERLPNWLHVYLNADDCDMYAKIGTWWMISAVARVIRPGCQADHMLIFEGDQGVGKSTAARILGGKWHLGSLPDLRNQSAAAMLIQGHWIVEVGELDAFKNAASARIKDFLTQTEDVYRRPYARTHTSRPRQCALIGTTNEATYLSDPTGNRRYWPCRVRMLRKAELIRDRDQLWAEAVARFKRGEAWHPTSDMAKTLGEAQERRVTGDIWEDKIRARLCLWGDTFITSEQIFTHILEIEMGRIERRHQNRVSECMTRIGWTIGRRKVGQVRRRGYHAPHNWLDT